MIYITTLTIPYYYYVLLIFAQLSRPSDIHISKNRKQNVQICHLHVQNTSSIQRCNNICTRCTHLQDILHHFKANVKYDLLKGNVKVILMPYAEVDLVYVIAINQTFSNFLSDV